MSSTGTSFLNNTGIYSLYIDDATGNVSIGSSNNPQSSALYVQGAVVSECNLIVNGTITAVSGISICNSVYLANSNDTAALPSFSWMQQSNVGMFHPADQAVGISTSAIERFRVDNAQITINSNLRLVLQSVGGLSQYLAASNSCIGVNTSNPTQTLTVAGSLFASGYCNLLLDTFTSASTSNAPTANALSNVYATGVFASNLSVTSSNTLFPQATFASNTAIYASNTINGGNPLLTGRLDNIIVLTSGTVYTPTPGISNVRLYVIGGGGGGGGANGNGRYAGGGGAGGIGMVYLSNFVSSNTYSISIGARGTVSGTSAGGVGGTTSITVGANTFSASGGGGGGYNTTGAPALGGLGGSNFTGPFTYSNVGACGALGFAYNQLGGRGADSMFGAGGQELSSSNQAVGKPGRGFGAGGGGAVTVSGGTVRAGGLGAPGAIIVEEYF